MKKAVLLFTIVVLLVNIVWASGRTIALPNSFAVTDTIKNALTTQSRRMIVCNSKDCIEVNLDSIKHYPASSYILLYKIAGSQYILEKKPDIEMLLNYKINKITILEDHIRIENVEYYDKKRAIIIE